MLIAGSTFRDADLGDAVDYGHCLPYRLVDRLLLPSCVHVTVGKFSQRKEKKNQMQGNHIALANAYEKSLPARTSTPKQPNPDHQPPSQNKNIHNTQVSTNR
jgi:hypothetical protein